MSLLTVLFLGFTALIVVCQLVPATILFIGMIKALFGKQESTKLFNSKGE